MKKIVFSALVLFSLLGCSKDIATPFSEITITGPDLSMGQCSCLYFGIIENTRYRVRGMVDNDVIKQETVFPKAYLIRFEPSLHGCSRVGGNEIIVTEIKER